MTPYRFLYRFGITPWERENVPEPLSELVSAWTGPAGKALDIGCGTGRDAVFLAKRGWIVTAVDNVPQALDAARQRARSASVEVNWIAADVTEIGSLGGVGGYDLIFDRGCFHGLTDAQRASCSAGMTAVAASGAHLLMLAFRPHRGLGPRGITADELVRQLGDRWELRSSEEEADVRLPFWLGDPRPTWYEFRRR